jgi:hypothetical protein
MPQSRYCLSDAHVVCLERVQCNSKGQCANAEEPVCSVADLGNALLGEVVDDA